MVHYRSLWLTLLGVFAISPALPQSFLAAEELRTTPLILKDGGTPDRPAIFDGKGMVIDLGIDITDVEWDKNGDIWTSTKPVDGLAPVADVQRAGLFLGDFPLRIARARAAEKKDQVKYVAKSQLQPGQMGWTDEGIVYFRWSQGLPPGSTKIIRPPTGLKSCVVIACSYLTVRNIVAKHAANDGFNIHGDRIGIRLENVKAISNGDEGISAHETVQMDVVDAEIAWNGSSAGGVADVNDSITTYTDCEVHHNLGAAFFFDGDHHAVRNCLIHHQTKGIVSRNGVEVETSNVVFQKD